MTFSIITSRFLRSRSNEYATLSWQMCFSATGTAAWRVPNDTCVSHTPIQLECLDEGSAEENGMQSPCFIAIPLQPCSRRAEALNCSLLQRPHLPPVSSVILEEDMRPRGA